MELAAQQFMRALRGRRSQRGMARRLGYRGNPMTDWEHGRRYPTVGEALRVASRFKVDVPAAFGRFAPAVSLESAGGKFAVGAWLRQLSKQIRIVELSSRSGLSRFAIGRWLSADRQPRLPDFFRLVDVITGRLPDLVAELVSIEEVPALRERYAAAQAARRIAFDEPWSEAILRVLEATDPSSDQEPGFIAHRLGISLEDEARVLMLLERAGLVQRRADKYVPLRPLTVDTRGGRDALHALRHHWSLVAAGRALAPRRGDVFAYNVLSVSEPDLERIRGLVHTTFREIRAIVAASEPADRVALLNLHLVGWNDEPRT
jgi:transcriptional regulator with XRE-family HTH domain